MSQPNLRAIAAKIIVKVVEESVSLSSALSEAEKCINQQSRPLLRQISYGVIRHYFSLSKIQSLLLARPLKSREKELHALILIGLYQIVYSRVPQHALVSETVNATGALKRPWASALVNGALRSMIRQGEKILDNKEWKDIDRYDHPFWLIDKCRHYWPEQWQNILQANNEHPPMTLRINSRRVTRNQYLEKLTSCDLTARETPLSPTGITLEKACPVDKLPGFTEGLISVQDEAAQLSVPLLDCQPGDRVLDACAAPGGKTCHLLEQTPSLDLWAVDVEEKRLVRLRENLARLRLQAHVICGDAAMPETWWDGQPFDRILLDAPCSATGVIRRHPDIKLLRRAEDVSALVSIQKKLIRQMWDMLKCGGLMVYATCSILREENDDQIESFLSTQADASLITVQKYQPYHSPYGMQFFPVNDGHDGFFYSILQKN